MQVDHAFSVSEEEINSYIAEAKRAYPTLDPLAATLALALHDARIACNRIDARDNVMRSASYRENRDRK